MCNRIDQVKKKKKKIASFLKTVFAPSPACVMKASAPQFTFNSLAVTNQMALQQMLHNLLISSLLDIYFYIFSIV